MPNATGTSTWINPLAKHLHNIYEAKSTNLISNAVVSYMIIPDLEIWTSLGYNDIHTAELNLDPSIAIVPEYRPFIQSSATYGNIKNNYWSFEPLINYKKKIKNGTFDVLIGVTFQQGAQNVDTE